MSSIDENLFVIFAVCNPGIDAKNVREEILNLLEDSKKKLINDEDLEKIVNSIKALFTYSFDSSSKVSSLYGSYIMRDNLEALYSYQDDLAKLTKEDVRNAFNTYFVSKNLTNVILKKD